MTPLRCHVPVTVTMTRADHHVGQEVSGRLESILLPDPEGGICEVASLDLPRGDVCAAILQTTEAARVCFPGIDQVAGA